jgi:hypothetical protein
VSSGVGETIVPDAVGNSLGSATYIGILSPPTMGLYTEALANGDSNDFYRFRLKQSASMNASLYGLTDDAQLALLDGAGRTLRLSSSAGTGDEVVSRTLSAGTYYLRVFSDHPIHTPYALSVTVANAPAAVKPAARSAFVFNQQPLASGGSLSELLRAG